MTHEVLARADQALETEDLLKVLGRRVGEQAILGHRVEYGTFTLHVASDHWVDVARALRDDELLSFDMFDCLFGVDDREDGFRVVCALYSTATGVRVLLDVKVPGGRETPRLPTLTGLYAGADWMERETWDMFGIEFEGHPGLAPRLLNVENFEGWPLRKDFFLATRAAKPWPGVKEPAETDEEGNVIERETGIGDAPGPTDLDKAMADHAKAVNAAAASAAAAALAEAEEEQEAAPEPEPAEEPEARVAPEEPSPPTEEPVEAAPEPDEPAEEAAGEAPAERLDDDGYEGDLPALADHDPSFDDAGGDDE